MELSNEQVSEIKTLINDLFRVVKKMINELYEIYEHMIERQEVWYTPKTILMKSQVLNNKPLFVNARANL